MLLFIFLQSSTSIAYFSFVTFLQKSSIVKDHTAKCYWAVDRMSINANVELP